MKSVVFQIGLAFGCIGVLFCHITSAQLNTAESILTLPATGQDRHFKIIEPNVRQRSTEYPSIIFQPNDIVKVRAGGCVQTGGVGLTWKRYVSPSGPNSDRLYRGMLWIPGAMSNLQFMAAYLDGAEASSSWSRDFCIPAGELQTNPYLTLGYTDDAYEDNGYYNKDSGTQAQCEGVDNAWFEIYITHSEKACPPIGVGAFKGIGGLSRGGLRP